MITGNDQTTTNPGDLRRQIERLLFAGCLNHDLAKPPIGKCFHLTNARGRVAKTNGFFSAGFPGQVQGGGSTAEGQHPRSCSRARVANCVVTISTVSVPSACASLLTL